MQQASIDAPTGKLFPAELTRQIKARFLHVDHDTEARPRLYFENAGGSFRLAAAVERFASVDSIPDCSERIHPAALELERIIEQGVADFRLMLNATGGAVYTSLTASAAMFDMVRAIAENVPGTNFVTTILEHPSSYDAVALYAQRLNKQLRVAPSNPATGGVDVNAIVSLVDGNTAFLSVMYASNISGAKIDINETIRRARAVKPDLYIIVDAVQHAPHSLIDLNETPVDAMNIAPYKFFGCRGSGMSWISDRTAQLPHHKLAGKPAGFWDLGSAAPAQFAVITAIVDYVCWIGAHGSGATDRRARFAAGMQSIELHERALLSRLLNGTEGVAGLRHMEGLEVLVDNHDLSKRDLIVAINITKLDPASAVRAYEERGIIVYERVASSLYSKRMLNSFGIEGAVRISPLHCHSVEDIDRFLVITADLARSQASLTQNAKRS